MAILIFDYDGTLHESLCIYEPAVRACVSEFRKRGMDLRQPSTEQIIKYLGLTTQEMWDDFAPELSAQEQKEGGEFIFLEMQRLIRQGTARLYDGTYGMLSELKAQGHTLVFLSNCAEPYMEENAQAFHLHDYFDEMYCAEWFDWKPKPQIVKLLINEWEKGGAEPEKIIVIGDRYKDMEIASVREGTGTIFCAYGYGRIEEGSCADAIAYSPAQIPECVSRICAAQP